MPLVVGVDSSTSACKVRCATPTPASSSPRAGRRTRATTPPRSEQDPRDWQEAFDARLRRGRRARSPPARRDRRRRPAARAGGARRGRRGAAAGQALERHRVGAGRRGAGGRAARRCRGLGGGRAAACRSPASPSPSCAWLRRCEPDAFGRIAAVLLPHDWLTVPAHGRAHHRPRRRVGHRLLVARARSGTGSTCSISSATGSTGTPRCPTVLGPLEAGRPVGRRRCRRRPGDRRQHGRRARARPASRRPRPQPRHQRHRVRGQRPADRRPHGHRGRLRRRHRALPARSSARSTPRR